jgi:hypothetical protein
MDVGELLGKTSGIVGKTSGIVALGGRLTEASIL